MDYRAQIDKYLSYIDSIRRMKGKDYQESGKVEIINVETYMRRSIKIEAKVKGSYNTWYNLEIYIRDGEFGQKFTSHCSCLDGSLHCKHAAATLYEIKDNSKYLLDLENKEKYRKGKELLEMISINDLDGINTFELSKEISDKKSKNNTSEVSDGTVKLELKLSTPSGSNNIFIEVYIGQLGSKIMYRVKDLIDFFERMYDNSYYTYSSNFSMNHNENKFEENSKTILNFILKHAEVLKIANQTIEDSDNYSYNYRNFNIKSNRFILSGIVLDDFFSIMQGKKIETKLGKKKEILKIESNLKKFKISAKKINNEDYIIKTNINGNSIILDGYKSQYLSNFEQGNSSISKLENKINIAEMDVLEMTKNITNNENESAVIIKEKDMPQFISKVLPKIKKSFDMESIKGTEVEKLLPKELKVKIYLDYSKKGNIILKSIYKYDDIEINPLETIEDLYQSFRDNISEKEVERSFKNTGFEIEEKMGQYILKSDEDIYRFLTTELVVYTEKFEVLVTDEFKSREIQRPKIGTLGVKVENNLIDIDFGKMNIKIEELANVLKQYKLKKKYYRLKDGTFFTLENNKDLDLISEITDSMNIDIKEINNGEFRIPLYRSIYLNNMLDISKNIDIRKNESFNKVITKIEDSKEIDYSIPHSVKNVLRDYQKVGYNWLKMIDEYNFGGILADDMGLGKTLETISVILSYIEKSKEDNIKPKPSIVICPSSLSLNWKNEIIKFNADINVMVIKGIAKDRKKLIKDINNHQLVIVSYDLIKRDIEEYINENIEFKYIVVDEAQYIKNSNTQNSKAIKKLNGETRFALTGTPIENSLSELWSIFDYILPGYLYGYTKFKNNIEKPIIKDKDEQAMKKLKMLIAPFILRRLKKDVLKELPEKTISILNNEMEDEQTKIYNMYLMQARKEANEELARNGIEKSQIKILSLLTRLRQVCCHPSLFIENYKGESSKLIQCMELTNEAIESGHKILLFSQYTSMFEIIEKELKEKNIKYFKLTGQTKVGDRIKLVDEFNETEKVKVFLISLKAGGTGLNLTAADTVIHYDPWWNLSAENQATDRVYRIGQKKAVQVYKLITSNTIEEKIQIMQERKGKLTDDVLTNEEVFINKLTKEEIMQLFE